MLDIFTAITTSITAILSVWIAYNSHKTTINEKKLDKEERSQKIIRLFQRENAPFKNGISILLKETNNDLNRELSELYGELFRDNLTVSEKVEQYDLIPKIQKYRARADKTIKDNLDQLTLEDERKLVNLTTYTTDLLMNIDYLQMISIGIDKQEEHIKEIEKNIEITVEKIIAEI
ncbi:hypothetical protein [Salinicoccus roseus]|uniref:hypothetical protein n=1 Tax=Salinicoccus roseus TaxID=45670 RepID=UPI002300833D|nr:hypothetical protein [Salinicoccus roseus]